MAQNLVLVVLGRKGSGKSTLVREVIREFDRVVILDYIGEYGAEVNARVIEGFEACVHELVENAKRPRFRLSLRVVDTDEALRVLSVAYELPRTLLVVEEASVYCTPQSLPVEVARFVRFGRHREISQVYVAQRPSMLHRDITSQADVIVSFRQHEQRDVDYLRGIMGEEAERVRTLGDYAIVAGVNLEKAPLAVLARLKS